MKVNIIFALSAFLFAAGVYGVLARKNAVLILMSIELILNAATINLIVFSVIHGNIIGQVFALFVIALAAAEVGIGIGIVLLLFRNRTSVDVDSVDSMRW